MENKETMIIKDVNYAIDEFHTVCDALCKSLRRLRYALLRDKRYRKQFWKKRRKK